MNPHIREATTHLQVLRDLAHRAIQDVADNQQRISEKKHLTTAIDQLDRELYWIAALTPEGVTP